MNMNGLTLKRTALQIPLSTARQLPILRGSISRSRLASSLPTIAEPSFWRSLIPKPLRREKLPPDAAALRKTKAKSKEWNPATFYIVIFILIGSMSIRMIALRRDFEVFMRQSGVRIGLLREVIEKIQKGEKVDVERVLGTGDPEKEKEWEEGTFSSS